MRYLNDENIYIFLIQVFVLLGLAKVMGEVFRKWKLPAFTAEILVGVVLGPTIFGRFVPELYQKIFPQETIQVNMFETVAWLGVLFLLLETGLELDFSSAMRQGGDAVKIALADIVVPMGISFAACLILPAHYLVNPEQRVIFALFMATAMAVSAIAITARALHDLGISKTDLGFLILSALSLNDIIGWLIFTLIIGMSTHAKFTISGILLVEAITIGFTFICLTAGRKITDSVISKMKASGEEQPAISLSFVCLLGLLCGAITQKIGIHALFGFFIAGIMAGSSKALSERTRHVISQMVHAIFVPLFFVNIGLRVDFFKHFNIFLAFFVAVISIGGKFAGAWLGVNFTKLHRENRLAIAIAHTPGGVTEIVVGLFALEYHLITEQVFIALIFGAVVSSIAVGPWLSYSIKKRKAISILEFFSHRAVLELKAIERDRAIGELCNMVAEQQATIDGEKLYGSVLERENAMGTAMEEGIAVPHARFETIKRPTIAFGRSAAGIEWNSRDGKASHFIFLIITPQSAKDYQVQILSHIARVMSNKQTRASILQAKDNAEVWAILHKEFTPQMIVRK